VTFLHQLVDALPIGIVVAGSDRRVMYANRHVAEKLGRAPELLSAEWLQQVGVKDVTEQQLADAYAQAMQARPGVIETLVVSRWAFLVMTPLKLLRPDGTQRFVAVAIRGERNLPGSEATY
jgi:PAS domain-containing protein